MNDINIEGVTKRYGDVTALDDVTLSIADGSTFGLLGTNGAGKTTLFRLLIGHERPDEGTLEVAGLPVTDGVAVRRRVGYLPENAGFPPTFTGREVLAFHADVRGIPADQRADRIDEVLETVGLAGAGDRAVGGYSNGMNRRLGLATALVARPRVLILDEPTSGLDPIGVEKFHDVIERLATETPITVLFTSHTLTEVEQVCDRIAVLRDGELRTAGRIEELRRAVGETVTVEVRVSEPSAASEVADSLFAEPDVRSVDRMGDTGLRLRCDRSSAYDVLAAVHGATTVEAFEVREPGLEEIFRDAVAETTTPAGAGGSS
jgi:Cu-processing system ATP-binding protein